MRIGEFSSSIVYRMLSWLYNGTYDTAILESDEVPDDWALPNQQFFLTSKLVAIADYYQVESLKASASGHIRALANEHRWSAEGFLEMARLAWNLLPPNDMTLKTAIADRLDRNFSQLCNDADSISAIGQGDEVYGEVVSRLAKAHAAQIQLYASRSAECEALSAAKSNLRSLLDTEK